MAMLTPLSFGALLKHLRRYFARMTQEQLADGSGYSVSYISMLERGERTPQSSTVELLAVALRLDDANRAALFDAYARASAHTAAEATPDAMPGARHGAAASPASAAVDASSDLRDGVALRTMLRVGLRGPKPVPDAATGSAAAAHAARFGALVESAVVPYGGQIEAVESASASVGFVSARQALRAAVALHARCLEERQHDATWPWHAGIGLHASASLEPPDAQRAHGVALIAAPGVMPPAALDSQLTGMPEVADGLAQHLCDLAGPGEILASDTVIGLARILDGLEYTERGRLQATGIASPMRVHQVVAAATARDTTAPQAMPLGGFLGTLPEGPLVGRSVELARIVPALLAALGGTGQVVMLSGEPGVGKTRLAQEATREARNHGLLVAVGRCYLPQQAVAYYPFLDLLAMLYACAPGALRAQVPERWPELGRLLPDLPAIPGAAVTPAGPDDQQRLFWQVAGFIEAVAAEQPVALLFDDLQWADQASLDLLLHLARQTRGARVFMLGIHRDSELPPQAPLQVALRELAHELLAERMPISLFAEDGTAALMAACLGLGEVSSEFATLVHEPTAGNAFFVREVVRTLIERGDLYWQDGRWQWRAIDEIAVPESVRATIGERVGRLAASTQTLLRAASVLGQTFSFDDVWHMQETDGQTAPDDLEVEAALAEATLAGLVRETGDEMYRFSHALTRRALASELSPRQRRRLHLAAGAAIERLPERTRTRRAAELARHFLAGDTPQRALPYLLSAGDQSEAVYAHAEAERHLRTALEVAQALGDRAREAEAAEKFADILVILVRRDEAAAHMSRALALYRESNDLEGQRRASAWLVRKYYLIHPEAGGAAAGWQLLSPFLSPGDQVRPTRGTIEIQISAVELYYAEGRHTEAAGAAEQLLAMAQDLDDRRSVAMARWWLAVATLELGRDDETLTRLEAARESLELVGDLKRLITTTTWIALLKMRRGQVATSEAQFERACELAARLGRPGTLIHTQVCLGQWALLAGDWARARRCLAEANDLWQHADHDLTWQQPWQATVHAILGPLSLAEAHTGAAATLEHAMQLAAALPNEGPERAEDLQTGHAALAEYRLLAGEADAACAQLAPLLDEIAAYPTLANNLRPLLAWSYLLQGDIPKAETQLAQAIEHMRARQHQLALVDALRVQALIAIERHQWRGGAEALADAEALAHAMPYPYAEAKAFYVHGLLYQAQGQWLEAQDRFNAALAILNQLGERLYAEHAERMARAVAARIAQTR